ncbi:hypothetical protein [Chryseobacterium viscerum]|uniref:HNH nuclease domain-containing protein n=1 Tax=Chryseobacterium viscerum TaxID=1037377 RepID=A0A316WHS2_9FLAO|nr:hypothetical protein [Chryseobacterium viscerum]PWN58678.1 hypothetical protein C1634_021720 [Chryseobacterium viscerum]
MKKIVKFDDSKIIRDSLQYNCKPGGNNSILGNALLKEQKSFCAYSEEFIDITSDSNDIEHFNPDLKCTPQDSYKNWFKTKNKVNFKKRLKELEFNKKGISFNDVLHPCENDFEDRLQYIKGEYRFKENTDDTKLSNLINLLDLNLPEKIERRKLYINRKKREIENFGLSKEDFFKMLISDDVSGIKYLRSIQEEFNLNIWEMIPETN